MRSRLLPRVNAECFWSYNPLQLYRLVQELLANTRRHAHARQVQLMRHGPELQLVVETMAALTRPHPARG